MIDGNACVKSNNTRNVSIPLSVAALISSPTCRRAVVVLWLGRKPDWKGSIRLLDSRWWSTCWYAAFFTSFAAAHVMLELVKGQIYFSMICFRVFLNALSVWCSSYLITKYSRELQFSKFMIITSRSKRTRAFGMVEKTRSKSLKSDLYFQRFLSLTGISKKRLISLQIIKVRRDEKISA